MQERQLAAAVVEGGARNADGLELGHDVALGVVHARIGQRKLPEEALGAGPLVLDQDAEEPDLARQRDGGALEDRELGAARRAPRAPQVHDDRVAAQPADRSPERLLAAREDPVVLRMQARQWGGRAGERALDLRGGRRGAADGTAAVARRALEADD